MRSPAVSALLASALRDRSKAVRAAAYNALGMIGDSNATSAIIEALRQEKDVYARKAGLYALGDLASQLGTPTLAKALGDKDQEIRGAAAFALSRYPDNTAVAALSQALSDRSAFVRAQAVRALAINSAQARSFVPQIVALLLQDEDNFVRRSAAEALGLIGDPSALPALRSATTDPDPYLRAAASQAVREIEPER